MLGSALLGVESAHAFERCSEVMIVVNDLMLLEVPRIDSLASTEVLSRTQPSRIFVFRQELCIMDLVVYCFLKLLMESHFSIIW